MRPIKFIKSIAEKNKKKMQDINYVKKLYKRSQYELLAIVLAFMLLLFSNYNYIIFKIKMLTEYIHTDGLNQAAQEFLEEDASFNNFDLISIGLYTERLKEEDKYLKLYKLGEFKSELKEMKKIGDLTKVYKTESGCGVISFKVFYPSMVKQVKENLGEIKDCDTVIIDLRNNTGGVVNSAVRLADLFLDKGDVIYSYEKKSSKKTVKSKNAPTLTPKKIIILQNEWTASASELFIMALKENLDNVTTVGTLSYGKGIGQNEYRLVGGYGFKFTAMRLFTPSGGSINGSGITPDIEYDKPDILEYVQK